MVWIGERLHIAREHVLFVLLGLPGQKQKPGSPDPRIRLLTLWSNLQREVCLKQQQQMSVCPADKEWLWVVRSQPTIYCFHLVTHTWNNAAGGWLLKTRQTGLWAPSGCFRLLQASSTQNAQRNAKQMEPACMNGSVHTMQATSKGLHSNLRVSCVDEAVSFVQSQHSAGSTET